MLKTEYITIFKHNKGNFELKYASKLGFNRTIKDKF